MRFKIAHCFNAQSKMLPSHIKGSVPSEQFSYPDQFRMYDRRQVQCQMISCCLETLSSLCYQSVHLSSQQNSSRKLQLLEKRYVSDFSCFRFSTNHNSCTQLGVNVKEKFEKHYLRENKTNFILNKCTINYSLQSALLSTISSIATKLFSPFPFFASSCIWQSELIISDTWASFQC